MITKRTKRTIMEGAGGGILGSFIGVPGLGVAAGVVHANKDRIKKFVKNIDDRYC